ncbi:MAG: T9SS type A sorting domain-containing protein [Ignavibacteriaceae bacterium]
MNNLTPSEFYLGQNYPNPFKEKTKIKYCLAYRTRVKITVYNSEGELIEVLLDEEKKAGTFEIEFSAVKYRYSSFPEGDDKEMNLHAGNYYYRLEAGNYSNLKKMILQK